MRLDLGKCRVLRQIETAPDYPHECTLPEDHFGPHLCWCGIGFTETSTFPWNKKKTPVLPWH